MIYLLTYNFMMHAKLSEKVYILVKLMTTVKSAFVFLQPLGVNCTLDLLVNF